MKNYIHHWSKESENLLQKLSRYGRTSTKNMKLSWEIGKKYHTFVDQNYLDIGHSHKKGKTLIQIPPGMGLIPDPDRHKFMRFRFYRRF